MIYVVHRFWLTKSAKNGIPHQDTSRRAIDAKDILHCKDRWDQLLEPTNAVPLELSDYYRAAFREGDQLGITPPVTDAISRSS
jgi:hypothetical protein